MQETGKKEVQIFWEVACGSARIGTDTPSKGCVFLELGSTRMLMHPEEAHNFLVKALVNIPHEAGQREDSVVADLAVELCAFHARRAGELQGELSDALRDLAKVGQELGEARGRLEVIERVRAGH